LRDLEMTAPLDTAAAALSERASLPEDALVGDKYTAASDLYCLGSIFDEHRFSTLHVDADGHDLLGRLRRPSQRQHASARQLRGHRWFAR
jgi:hypothetical protein